MHSGSTLLALRHFDAWLGAHQKIDRVARKHLINILPVSANLFPSSRAIVKFEGINGPDGIKRKNPSPDEPWHFIDPYDASDNKLIAIIAAHHDQLVAALKTHNPVRAAFEAAWLAHATVDGLTPAHHYPYEEELMKLRNGEGNETRNSIKEKILLPGETLPKQVRNNWKMWGDKGLLASHLAFEVGVAAIIMPARLGGSLPTAQDLALLQQKGFIPLYRARALQIAKLDMYAKFCDSGWTPRLAKQVRRELVPLIVNTVTLVWYGAVLESQRPS